MTQCHKLRLVEVIRPQSQSLVTLCHKALDARQSYLPVMSDREARIVSDLNTTYLDAGAMADIERLGIELTDGAPLTVCDYDADEDGNPAWVVAQGIAHFDRERGAWQIHYLMEDVRWEPREP